MLAHNSAAGFYNAKASKLALFTVSSCSILASILKAKHLFPIYLTPHLLKEYQFHRLVTSHWVFSGSSELLFGGVLMYQFRVLERLFGTRKYVSFVGVTTTLATLLEVGCLVLFRYQGLSTIPSGPYAWIFANLYLYQEKIPENDKFRLFGMSFSQKSFIYLMAIQLVASNWPSSIVPSICGFVAGAFYHANIGSIQEARFPSFLERFAGKILSPLLSSDAPTRTSNPEPPQAPSSRNSSGRDTSSSGPANQAPRPGSTTVPINEESIGLLVSMGFERQRAEEVLRRVGGDMERAVQALL